MSGGGSGGGGQTVAYQTNIPEYAAPYFQKLLGQAQALSDQPYQPYTGERVSQFTPLQTQAFAGAAGREIAPQLAAASQISQNAAMQGLGQQYTPASFSAPMVAPGQVAAGNVGFERVGTGAFTAPGTAQSYMSPYIQNVINAQQQNAQRQADIARTQRGAQAAGAGAFGGSRQAIMEAEAAKNLAAQKGDIQSQGLQAAYTQGRDAFMMDQARALQAQQANQQAGLTAGQAGLESYMRAQLANQQAGLTAGQVNQQAAMEAQRLAEQSRQYGAGFGLQGAQTALQGAQQLGQLGQAQFGQESDIIGQKMSLGTSQQQQIQNILGQQQADFQAQRNYPYQQLGYFSDLLRGVQGTSRAMYSPAPSPIQNLAALGSAAYGVGRIAGMAKGGTVKPAGLQELALARMRGA